LRFIDEVEIFIQSGKGGDGCSAFRREKHLPNGGPDGGDGGDGGSVYIQAHAGLSTLLNYRGKKNYQAENGEQGTGRQMNGSFGEDTILKVPVGTIIRHIETNEVIADLTEDQQKILIAPGGRGGLGNMNFKSSTNQAPTHAQSGGPAIELEIGLELKLIADFALIGMPNAGKSTLISVISAAKPKIADYPFTTLEPNLGVVKIDHETTYVIADIPGLIEDASEGKGLGIKFLKHIERTKAFIHLVDISWCLNEYEAFEQYVVIRNELSKYNEELINKKEIVCLTKIDAMTDEEVNKFKLFFEEELDRKVLCLSAVSNKNIDQLKALLPRILKS
jgi:GTP-binding protein